MCIASSFVLPNQARSFSPAPPLQIPFTSIITTFTICSHPVQKSARAARAAPRAPIFDPTFWSAAPFVLLAGAADDVPDAVDEGMVEDPF